MIYTDSNYWIAVFSEADEHHSNALELSRRLSNESYLLSEHCFGEVFTFLNARHGAEIAKTACNAILNDPSITITQASEEDWKTAVTLASKYGTSFADAITVTLMGHDGVKRLVSFDSDFDRFPKTERIY